MCKNSNKQSARSDTTAKPKSKQRSEEYLKYQHYIRSKEFQEVKDLVRERDKICQCCGRTQEEIDESPNITFTTHHRTYRHLFEGGETEAADCILLCSCCHKGIHSVKSNFQRFKKEKQ